MLNKSYGRLFLRGGGSVHRYLGNAQDYIQDTSVSQHDGRDSLHGYSRRQRLHNVVEK